MWKASICLRLNFHNMFRNEARIQFESSLFESSTHSVRLLSAAKSFFCRQHKGQTEFLPPHPPCLRPSLGGNVLLPVHCDSDVGATFEGVSTVLHSRGRPLRWLQQDKHCVLCALRTKLALSGTREGTHERRHTSVLLLCTVLSGHRHSQHIAAHYFVHGQVQCISEWLSFSTLSVLGCIVRIFSTIFGRRVWI